MTAMAAVIFSGLVLCPCKSSAASADPHSCCSQTTAWRAAPSDCCTADAEQEPATLETAADLESDSVPGAWTDPADHVIAAAAAASSFLTTSPPRTVLRI